MNWEYTLRVSTRAKRVNLKMTAEDGLVVTVPKRYNQKKLPEVLARHEAWIRTMHERFAEERAKRLAEPILPETISLPAIGEAWQVIYEEIDGSTTVKLKEQGNTLLLYGAVENVDLCLKALKRWLRNRAREAFVPLLNAFSEEMGVKYSCLRVGNQKSRWGSCSSDKTISLNIKLLFLSEKLMGYVVIHELSHISHMNHSKKYWQYVEKFEPNYRLYDKELRKSWGFVPQFMMSF